MSKDVALALSSGGPRGFAYIGAIEELESRGYRITSVSGCSIGSLVGGVYAAGGLGDFKQWLFSLDNFKLMSLLDVSFSKSYLVKGEKVIEAIKEIVPDVNIEDLDIPYTAVATDLYTGEEVVFSEGNLFEAIRASISIPSMFKPVQHGYRVLIDGGIVNTMPLNRVARSGHDILVGFDVNEVDVSGISSFLKGQEYQRAEDAAFVHKSLEFIETVRKDDSLSLIEKVKRVGGEGELYLKRRRASNRKEKELREESLKNKIPVEVEDNYYSILSRTFDLMNHTIARLGAQVCKPDIMVKMSLDSYRSIKDYTKGKEISDKGRELMAKALDKYEKQGK